MSIGERLKKGELSRWLVALVISPPIIVAIFSQNQLYMLGLTAVIGGLAWWEFFVNLLGRDRMGLFILAIAGWLGALAGAFCYGPPGQELGIIFSLALGALYLLVILPPEADKSTVNLFSRYALGHLYLTFTLSFIILIKKEGEYGPNWLLFTILITAMSDTGAFYAGSRLKGPKLLPKVSPNKTISGLVGGCILSMVFGALSVNYLPHEYKWVDLAFLALFLSLWGSFGDLFESALKRAMGIKDTSHILMGHGGIWDRLDSLMFNLPVVYFFIFLGTKP